MRFAFNETKAAQAASYLLKLSGGRQYHMHLIKLLYLADREMLVKHGRTITGDRLVSMKNGPVLSTVLDLINSDSPKSVWSTYVSPTQDYQVTLRAEAPTDELSRFELGLLEYVFARYGKMNRYALRDHLHEILPEWKDPGSSSCDIDPLTILRGEQWDEQAIEEAKRAAEEDRFLSSLG